MKNSGLCFLAVVLLTQSCGTKNKGNQSTSNFKTKMHLMAFVDFKNQSTLDITKLEGLPKVVNLKNDMTSVKNQAERGTCTFFAAMALVEAAIKKDQKIETNLSEEYLNYETKSAGVYPRIEGSITHLNLNVLKKTGILLEKDWSYQPSWFAKGLPCSKYKSDDQSSPATCYSHNRPNATALKKLIPSKDIEVIALPANTNAIIKFLARERRPISFAIMVNEKGFPKTGDVFYDETLREECLKKPDTCGGHAMTLTGYDLNKKVFFLKNSYGEDWGIEGYGTVTFDTIDRFSTGEYYSIKLKNKLSIQKDEIDNDLKLNEFSVRSKLENNNSLTVRAFGKIKGAEGRFIYVSSFLVKKKENATAELSDYNTETINLSADSKLKFNDTVARSMVYFIPGYHDDQLQWDTSSPINLDIEAEMVGLPEVALNTKNSYLRTTIYSYTDNGYNVLKRIYHQLTQE